MIRARFITSSDDFRPVNWPLKHPYWCSGQTDDGHIIIAYADDINEIKSNWPEATEIEADEVDKHVFTSRFPKPKWFKEK